MKKTIKFGLAKRRVEGELIVENVPIEIWVTFSGNRVRFGTGYRIDADKWDQVKQRVIPGVKNKNKETAADINFTLAKYEVELQEIFKRAEMSNISLEPKALKREFQVATSSKTTIVELDNKNFNTAIARFLSYKSKEIRFSSLNRYNVCFNHVKRYNSQISFSELDENGLESYFCWLRDVLKLQGATIKKHLTILKSFLRWSYKKGYLASDSFEKFSPKIKTFAKQIIFLSWEELMQLKEFKIPKTKKYLERVRDVFLLQCFTGLRYSDVAALQKCDIYDNSINIVTVKTGERLKIELNKYSREIIDKYKGEIPTISLQKMNTYLKELGEIVGLNSPIKETVFVANKRIDKVFPKFSLISTHAGRRTFICNALSLGIPVSVVMKWTGHSDYDSMKPYIDISDSIKSAAMDKFDKL